MSVIVFFYCQFYWLRDALTEPWPIVTGANLFATDGHTDYRTYPFNGFHCPLRDLIKY